MPSSAFIGKTRGVSRAKLVVLSAVAWLVLITGLHFWLNYDHGSRKTLQMGYMPVITNLAAPLLDHLTSRRGAVHFKAIKFASFAEMAEALRNDEIQIAFMIAPLAVVLRQQGEDVKVIYIGNRHESTLVARKELGVKDFKDLAGKTVAVPMRYSGHNISLLKLIQTEDLAAPIKIVEMNPPDMASALTAGSLDAYYVGEPFAAQTLRSGAATLVHYVESVWPNFICNLVVVKQALIEKQPDAVRQMVRLAARSGIWARQNTKEAALIASHYWNQPFELVEYALTVPANRIVYDRFRPRKAELQQLADLMLQVGLLKTNVIDGLVENRFALNVDLENITDDIKSIRE